MAYKRGTRFQYKVPMDGVNLIEAEKIEIIIKTSNSENADAIKVVTYPDDADVMVDEYGDMYVDVSMEESYQIPAGTFFIDRRVYYKQTPYNPAVSVSTANMMGTLFAQSGNNVIETDTDGNVNEDQIATTPEILKETGLGG